MGNENSSSEEENQNEYPRKNPIKVSFDLQELNEETSEFLRNPGSGISKLESLRLAASSDAHLECKVSSLRLLEEGEGDPHSTIYNSLVETYDNPEEHKKWSPSNLVDISEMVRTISFMAFSKKDADSLTLPGEMLDFVGDFPYLCDETEVESFEQLFHFVASHDFQLVAVDNDELAVLSIFVIRPGTLGREEN